MLAVPTVVKYSTLLVESWHHADRVTNLKLLMLYFRFLLTSVWKVLSSQLSRSQVDLCTLTKWSTKLKRHSSALGRDESALTDHLRQWMGFTNTTQMSLLSPSEQPAEEYTAQKPALPWPRAHTLKVIWGGEAEPTPVCSQNRVVGQGERDECAEKSSLSVSVQGRIPLKGGKKKQQKKPSCDHHWLLF